MPRPTVIFYHPDDFISYSTLVESFLDGDLSPQTTVINGPEITDPFTDVDVVDARWKDDHSDRPAYYNCINKPLYPHAFMISDDVPVAATKDDTANAYMYILWQKGIAPLAAARQIRLYELEDTKPRQWEDPCTGIQWGLTFPNGVKAVLQLVHLHDLPSGYTSVIGVGDYPTLLMAMDIATNQLIMVREYYNHHSDQPVSEYRMGHSYPLDTTLAFFRKIKWNLV